MKIDDIPYFASVRERGKWDYQLAIRAEKLSSQNPSDKIEFARRVALLASHSKPEIVSQQIVSFISEVEVFNKLTDEGKEVHWVSESNKQGVKTPDIAYIQNGVHVPVEVKTLDIEMHEAKDLRSFNPVVHESSPDWDYFEGCKNKLDYYFTDASEKFNQFNNGDLFGELYVIFLPSVHVRLRDGEDGKPIMQVRIDEYARQNLDKRVQFTSINSLDKW
ncbi:MAG TPA: hypothetical protein VLG11_01410 [Candidatus Saccharimonadales bacterium]|nr:hypothetical protein [Candidatus Saccharimonadales bacterium]